MGIILGVFVTLSSVGAGAFGIMALVIMFPNLPMIRIIGSDVVRCTLNPSRRSWAYECR